MPSSSKRVERVPALRRVTGKKPDSRVHFADPVAMTKPVKEKEKKRKAEEVRGRSPEKKVKSKKEGKEHGKKIEEPRKHKEETREKEKKDEDRKKGKEKKSKEEKASTQKEKTEAGKSKKDEKEKGSKEKDNEKRVEKKKQRKDSPGKDQEKEQTHANKTRDKTKEKKRVASTEKTDEKPGKSQKKKGQERNGSDDQGDGTKTPVKNKGCKKKVEYIPAVAGKIKHIFNKEGLTKKQIAEAKFKELVSDLKSSDTNGEDLDFDLDEFETEAEQEESAHSPESSDEAEEEAGVEEAEESSSDEPEQAVKVQAIDDPQESDSQSESAEGSDDAEEDTGDEEEGEEDEEGEGKEPNGETHALVAVTNSQASASKQAIVVRNSSTNKRDWDAYMRQVSSKGGKFPSSLSEHFQKDKLELFNIWLDCDKDWNSCKLEVERRTACKTTAEKGWEAVQGKELRKRFQDVSKFNQLVKARKESGLCFEDEDFPGDEDEMWFWMRAKQKYSHANITEESMKLKGKADVDKGLREALIDGENGILRAGVLPKVEGASSSGAKALLNNITAVAAAPKKKPKDKKDPEEVVPKTLKDEVAEKLGAMLQTAASARNQSIKLSTTEYGKDLSSTLLAYAESLEQDYKRLKAAMDGGEDKLMKKLMKVIRSKEEPGAKAQQAATAMLKPPAKKKAKKEDKEKPGTA